jgi:alpha-L-fucosidase
LKRSAFTAEDIRFTTNGDALYATVLSPPKDDVLIRSLARAAGHRQYPISHVSLLGSDEPVQWSLTDRGLRISPRSRSRASTPWSSK